MRCHQAVIALQIVHLRSPTSPNSFVPLLALSTALIYGEDNMPRGRVRSTQLCVVLTRQLYLFEVSAVVPEDEGADVSFKLKCAAAMYAPGPDALQARLLVGP